MIFAPHATHPHLREKDPGYIVVEYPDGSGGCIYSGYGKEYPEHWSHMMFNYCGGKSSGRRTSRSLYTDPSVPAELKGISYSEESRGVFIRSGAAIDEAIASS